MGEDYSEEPITGYEAARHRKAVDVVLGNGKPGLVGEFRQLKWIVLAIGTGILSLLVAGQIRLSWPEQSPAPPIVEIAPQKPPNP